MKTARSNIPPLQCELPIDTETPITLFSKLCKTNPYVFLFESAEQSGESGKYSFIGFDPLFTVSLFEKNGKGEVHIEKDGKKKIASFTDPLAPLKNELSKMAPFQGNRAYPRFQAGLVGYFGYDLVTFFEPVKLPKKKHPFLRDIPEGIFFFPKTLLTFDHRRGKLLITTYETKPGFLETLKKKITKPHVLPPLPFDETNETLEKPFFEKPENPEFIKMALRAKTSIRNGECIQIVLSQRYEMETQKDDMTLYRLLRRANPSPYMFLMRLPGFSIIGSSPETLMDPSTSSSEHIAC